MDLSPKQQTSEAIRQAETILITTGQHPTVDQIAAVMALTTILRKFGKRVSAVVSDSLPIGAQFLDTSILERKLTGLRDFVINVDTTKGEVESLRYDEQGGKLSIFITPFKGEFSGRDVSFAYGDFHYDVAIVIGAPSRSRIDRIYSEHQDLFANIPVINIDFRRSNENYGAVNLIEPTASSLCEIIVALSDSLQNGLIDADVATIMLAGIMSATERFTASHTSSKSLTVAAQMMAAGARQQDVVKGLFRGDSRPAAPAPREQTREHRPEREKPMAELPSEHKVESPEPQPRKVEPVEQNIVAEAEPVLAPAAEPVAAPAIEAVKPVAEPIESTEPAPERKPIELPPIQEAQLAAAAAPDNTEAMSDFTAAAEILRQHHARLVNPDTEINTKDAA